MSSKSCAQNDAYLHQDGVKTEARVPLGMEPFLNRLGDTEGPMVIHKECLPLILEFFEQLCREYKGLATSSDPADFLINTASFNGSMEVFLWSICESSTPATRDALVLTLERQESFEFFTNLIRAQKYAKGDSHEQ